VTDTTDYTRERRREHRVQTKEAVLVTLLGPLGGPPIEGTVTDLSGSGLQVVSSRPLPCGTLVKVEGPNRLMLGEVLRSEPVGDSFTIGIKLKHALHNLTDLERLNRELLKARKTERGAEQLLKR
jgi:hypothetical protein